MLGATVCRAFITVDAHIVNVMVIATVIVLGVDGPLERLQKKTDISSFKLSV